MPKIGRNDPCWCGSGKKYKQCHLVADDAAAGEQRRLKAAGDALLPRLIERAQQHTDLLPTAFSLFWNDRYTLDQMATLDELEGRGAERFLTWFTFDYPLADGHTVVERLAAGSDDFERTDDEAALLEQWARVRLAPFVVESSVRAREIHAHALLGDEQYTIEDQAASRRVDDGEVLIVHLLPVGPKYYIGGAAAHLTADTAATLRTYSLLHLAALQQEHPDADANTLLYAKSYLLNHFIMHLPVDAPDPTVFERILQQTRAELAHD